MSVQVYKVNLTGYVIRNTDIMDDPNHIDLSTVVEMVLDNQHECTMDLVESTDASWLHSQIVDDIGQGCIDSCDCTECTCGAKTESVPLMMNLEEPGASADSTVEDF